MSKKIQKAFEEWWIDEDLGSDLYDLHKGDARYVWTQCAESRDTEVKELEHDLRQYKKHVNKLMERYNIKDGRGDLIEIQHHWFKNLIEWHREATK